MTMSDALQRAIETIAERWERQAPPWLIGGSCGLLLQEVEVSAAPRDLDIYVDGAASALFHEPLAPFATDEPIYSETEKYRSTLSHYRIEEIAVELVAGFEVLVPGASYRVAIEGLILPYAPSAAVRGASIRLMPLSHELLFNMLRERPDRYEAIAAVMRSDLETHLPAMRAIARASALDRVWLGRLASLLRVEADRLGFDGEGPLCP